MGKVLMEITMSLDGYTTGPEVSAEEPLGRGGERLDDSIRQQSLPWRGGGERGGGCGPRNRGPAVRVLATWHQATPGHRLFPCRLQPQLPSR